MGDLKLTENYGRATPSLTRRETMRTLIQSKVVCSPGSGFHFARAMAARKIRSDIMDFRLFHKACASGRRRASGNR